MELIQKAKELKRNITQQIHKKRIIKCELNNYKDNMYFIERDILVLAHSLEKGMGVPNPRKGYGKEKAKALAELLLEYLNKSDALNFAFYEGVAVLDQYISLMKMQKENVSNTVVVREKISELVPELRNYCKSGVTHFEKESLVQMKHDEFEQILMSRHSIRHFSKEIIMEEELENVIRITNHAPSACNRQPVKIYYTKSQEKAREFEKLIDGSHGFKGETPYYMLVTVNRAYFSEDEYLQWYVNGGIYLGFLTLSLHANGIGSIILQWKYGQKKEHDVKKMFKIDKTEAIVAIVGYGKYPIDGTKCILAQRKTPKETMIGI